MFEALLVTSPRSEYHEVGKERWRTGCPGLENERRGKNDGIRKEFLTL